MRGENATSSRFGGVCGLVLASLLSVCPQGSVAQNPYPGWSAPKRPLPPEFINATFPDIVANGDVIHLVFRATFTTAAGEEGIAEEELILDEIQQIDVVLRTADDSIVETLGGRQALSERRKDLIQRLNEIQSQGESDLTRSTSPVQTAIYYTRSDDRGKTFWEKPVMVTTRPENFFGQTALEADGNTLHLAYTGESGDNVIHVNSVSSTDGGNTWSRPEQISTSDLNCFDPCLSPIPGGGLVLTWWELEETQTEGRPRPDFQAMNELVQRGSLLRTTSQRIDSVVRYARYLAGSWQSDRDLDVARGVIPYLNSATGPNNEVYVFWKDDLATECRVSQDGGVTWQRTLDFAQVFDDRHAYNFIYGKNDFHFVRGGIQKNAATPLAYKKGRIGGSWRNIIDQQAQDSFPNLGLTKDEIQIVWGTTDLSGKHPLYFREDNKPPTSELVYPPDGQFTKYGLTFLWRAEDDIATRMEYRYVFMKRESPEDEVQPHNWSLYEAREEISAKPQPDGYYTLFLQAKDFSQNEEPTPKSFNFHTYYVPPALAVDYPSAPTVEIETRYIEIKWLLEDNNPGETPLISYRVDGNPVKEFARRETVIVEGLTDGWHTIQLFAKDENGNISPFGETITVNVNLTLELFWRQVPLQPRQGEVVFVKEDRANISWGVRENTADRGVSYNSVIRVIHEGQEDEWSDPQFSTDTELTGEGGAPLEEGSYVVQVMAQDQFGNRVDNYVFTQFTVDHTPPDIQFVEDVQYDKDTDVPTVAVAGKDNYTLDSNIRYQFLVEKEEEGGSWSAWSPSTAFVCEGHPIKWYSFGYRVLARAQDIAGNVSFEPEVKDLRLFARYRWLLPTLIGIVSLIVLGLVFLVVSTLLERRRQKKRLEARKEAAKKQAETVPAPEGAAAAGVAEDDLFEVPETVGTAPRTAEADPFSSDPASAGSTKPAAPQRASDFDDPFSASNTEAFDDPFTETVSPDQVGEEEAPYLEASEDESDLEPLEIGADDQGEDESDFDFFESTAPTQPIIEPPKEEEKPRSWSPNETIQLDDRDLFDPLS